MTSSLDFNNLASFITSEVQELYPEYRGALVVCDGGGDSQIQLQVLQAVQALTGLNANQISICERTGGSQE